MKITRNFNYQSGQALLLVILIMVVVLTVGLSSATRSITSTRTSAEEDNTQRAFSAAEAGIEQALMQTGGSPISGSLANNTTYQTIITEPTTSTDPSGNSFILNNGITVSKDNPVDIWLSDYSANTALIYQNGWSGNIKINWGSGADACENAALDIILISQSKSAPLVTHYPVDPCSARATHATRGNNFEYLTTIGDLFPGRTEAFSHKKEITIPQVPPGGPGVIMRIIPLYKSAIIGIEKSATDPIFPSQGKVITSVGVSDESERKIISLQSFPTLPVELFPYILFVPK